VTCRPAWGDTVTRTHEVQSEGKDAMQLTEIRWHARAGQGAVTAAKVVAETALSADQYMQAMPEYGPERMGAPIKAFTRICDEPIEIHNNIENPDVVIVLDETLLDVVNVAEGLKSDGVLIINTCSPAADVKKALGVADTVRVATVDASGIALDTIKRDIPNTPIVGALIKVTGVIDLEVFKSLLAKNLGKKFGQQMIDDNHAAVQRAYEEVTVA
jgi:pyruvate ferredoxin oxidoreductase gamma subunit